MLKTLTLWLSQVYCSGTISCEAPTADGGHVNHLILSSEPLQGENVWIELGEGEIAAVDHFMRFVHLDTNGAPHGESS